ncbi:hypothetical protein Bca4012_025769 [Brassica carinata]
MSSTKEEFSFPCEQAVHYNLLAFVHSTNPPDLFYSKWNARFRLFIPFYLRSIPLICSSSYVCRFGMDNLGLPYRLFETGYESTRKKWVNNYFNLRWIQLLNSALEDEDLAMLDAGCITVWSSIADGEPYLLHYPYFYYIVYISQCIFHMSEDECN